MSLAPILEHSPRPGLRLWGGPLVRYTATDLGRDRLVAVARPRGSDDFGRAGLQPGAILTNVDSADAHDVAFRVSATGELFPPLFDVTGTYGSLRAEAGARLPLGKSSASPWVAARLGAQRVWGPFPYDDAAYLGGERTLRGYHYQRFAGDAAVYGGMELRLPVARVLDRLVPTRIVAFALGDAGRVWARGTRSNRVHAAAGGGVSLSFFEDRYTVSLAEASGAEGSRWYLRTGVGF